MSSYKKYEDKMRDYMKCEVCGGEFRIKYLSVHSKSKRHLFNMYKNFYDEYHDSVMRKKEDDEIFNIYSGKEMMEYFKKKKM